MAAKKSGWKTTVVDYTDKTGLLAKYSKFPELELSAIEDVDRVWEGGPLEAAFPSEEFGSYDALIASHVIEHIIDPVSFFVSASRLLKDSGQIRLAVPDKRLCFDCFRPTSTTGQVIAAARAKRKRHAYAAVFDAWVYDARPADGSPSWARDFRVRPQLTGSLESAFNILKTYYDDRSGEYLDIHGWVFTPASFGAIMLELEVLGVIDWRIVQLVEQEAVEFLVTFGRSVEPKLSSEAVEACRRRFLIRQLEELREQANWMLGEAR